MRNSENIGHIVLGTVLLLMPIGNTLLELVCFDLTHIFIELELDVHNFQNNGKHVKLEIQNTVFL